VSCITDRSQPNLNRFTVSGWLAECDLKLDQKAINRAAITVRGTFCTDSFNIFSKFFIIFVTSKTKVE